MLSGFRKRIAFCDLGRNHKGKDQQILLYENKFLLKIKDKLWEILAENIMDKRVKVFIF